MLRLARAYQIEAVKAIKALWQQGKRSVVVVGPVGAGKTFVAELLMVPALEHEWAQVVFVGHTETLIDQPAQRFNHMKIRSAFLKAGRKEDRTQALQFCSAATLVRRNFEAALNSKGMPFKRCLLILDEGHRCKSNTYISILNKLKLTFEYIYILLLTATPYRLDGRGLSDIADAVVEISTPRQLMSEGVILSPRYFSTPLPDGDPDEVVLRPGIVGDVVKTWLLRGKGLPTICRAYSIDHSKLLVQRFLDADVAAAHIDGTMTTAARRRLLVALATRHLSVLCAGSNIFDEGFDSRASYEMLLPQGGDALEALQLLQDETLELGCQEAQELRERVLDGVLDELRDFYGTLYGDGCLSTAPWLPPRYVPLAVLVDAAPTASMGAWMQRQGRVVRSWEGKTEAIVLCHSSNLERHGALIWHDGEHCESFALRADAKWATKPRPGSGVAAFRCPKPRTCPECLCVDVDGGDKCAWCGEVLARDALPEEHAGELVERSAETAVVSTPGIKEAFLRARYREMRERVRSGLPPYKPNYAAARYWRRFGHWPQRGLDAMLRREFGFGN